MRKKLISVFLTTAITISSVLSAGFSVTGEAKAAPAETDIADTEVPVTNVYLGTYHSAALTENGVLFCWGSNTSGQIGNGKTEHFVDLPQKTLEHVSSASLGLAHSAAITEDGSLYCWGDNWYQQIGNGSEAEAQTEPVKVLDHVSSVSLGDNHSAAVTEDGSLYCWGYNKYGQVGNGTTVNQPTPMKVLDNVSSVLLGYEGSMALTETGDLYCWGHNHVGQVGNGSEAEIQTTPVKVMDNVSFVVASPNCYHFAALTENGDLYCWGYNAYGQVGNGTTADQPTPVKVMGNVLSVSLGRGHTAAITENGSLYCWGDNQHRQIGNGSEEDTQIEPVEVMGNAAGVSLGDGFSAAIDENGDLYCWGYNYYGQVGNDTTEIQPIPVKVLGNVSSVSLGDERSTAITKTGALYIWGSDSLNIPTKILGSDQCPHRNTEVRGQKDASCKEEGYSGDTYCKDCGEEIAHGQVIAATGRHVWGEGTEVKPPTCAENGEKKYICSVCGETKIEETSKTPHTYEETIIKATTEKNGSIAEKCTSCGHIKSSKVIFSAASMELEASSYTYDGEEKTPAVTVKNSNGEVIDSSNYTVAYKNNREAGKATATVELKGNYSGTLEKTFDILSKEPPVTECTHQNTEVRGQKDASCKEEGYSGDTYCKDCGEEIAHGQVIAVTDTHTWDEGTEVKPPTCAENGEKKYICSVCGESRIEEITKTAHTYEEIIIKATTTENGSITEKCTSCGHIKSSKVIFSAASIDLETSSYTYDGEEKTPAVTIKNSNGEVIDSSNYTVAYKNNREAGKATATVNLKGNYAGTLEKTFDILPKEPPATECTHQNTEVRGQKDASCKEEGYSGDTYCKDCGEEIAHGQVIAVTDTHTWDEGTEVKPPTCAENGEKKYICSVCGETKIEETPKTSHTYEEIIAKATPSKNGSIVEACSVCGKIGSTKVIFSVKTLTLSSSSYIYDGKAKTPSVTVKDSAGNTIDKRHYTVIYQNNKKIGEATVTVKLKNNLNP